MVDQPSRSAHTNSRRRPGGRTADVTARVHKAILDLIVERGVEACTFSAVAERAGIERSTLYRRFPDRWDAIIDAFMDYAQSDVTPDLGENFANDLESVLRKLRDTLESPLGPALVSVAAGLRRALGSDYTRAYFDRRMAQLNPMFDAAIIRGELPAAVDREELFTFAAAPIWYRTFVTGRGANDADIRAVVESACWLYCSPSAAAKFSRPARIT
jgi:AcrR family transcriptional regulator